MTTKKLTKSHKVFRHTFARAMGMLESSVYLHTQLYKEQDFNRVHQFPDMARAAIVIGVSAFDAYFTSKFTEILVPFLKKNGPTIALIDVLAKAGLDTRTALELLPMQRPYRRIRTLVDGHLEKFVTQRFRVIDSLFDCFTLSNFSAGVQKRAKRKNLLRSVEILIERRHDIAHCGDLDSRGKLQKVDPKEFLRRLRDLETFVLHAESLVNLRITKIQKKK